MLSYMRKNAKSWIIIIPVGIIIMVFVFFYGFSDVRKTGGDTVIASVGERKITMAEYQTAYKNMLDFYRTVYKNQFSDEMIETLGLKQKVLEDLIDRELLLREAEKLNIQITPEQIRQAIVNTPIFQDNGAFNNHLYERVLRYYGISALDYEREKERELKIKHIEDMIRGAVKVSKKEIQDAYTIQNQTVKIAYGCFEPDKVEQEPEVSQELLSRHYENNKETFRVPEKVKAAYIVFDPEKFERKVEIAPEEISDYYDADPEQFFEPAQVKARHILFKADSQAAPEETARKQQQAAQVLEQLKKGARFEELARQYSEDTASAENGGDLGFFKRGDMMKPFEEAAFALKPGEHSALVRTAYGFHIIKVEAVRQAGTKPLEEVKARIERELRTERALEAVRSEARRAFNRLFKSRNLEEYAEQNGLKLKETDYFAYGKAPEDPPGSEQFSKEAFLLSPGELAPAFAIGQKYYLLKLIDKKESHIPPLEEVRQRIQREVVKELKMQLAREQAEKVLSALREGTETWEQLAKKHAVTIQEAEFKRPGDFVQGIGAVPELKEAAFGLETPNTVCPQVFQTSKGAVLFKLLERHLPDEAEMEKEKEAIQKQVREQKQAELFNQYQQNLKAQAELWVNTKLAPAL